MVRFIIYDEMREKQSYISFTFQYGQIYYSKIVIATVCDKTVYIPIWLDLLFFKRRDMSKKLMSLHSNMVRFIIQVINPILPPIVQVYIPIWLDLLLTFSNPPWCFILCLHSNMVRFIIYCIISLSKCHYIVYIPIWLDLLFLQLAFFHYQQMCLHSNMVRFIIR